MNQPRDVLKIALVDSEPLIWRRFAVPASIRLDALHDVIQVVMGWRNSHLYHFEADEQIYTPMPETSQGLLKSDQFRLCDLVKKRGDTCVYLYDMGDSWEHLLTLEDPQFDGPELKSAAVFLDGALACPPEDVGGIWGYAEYLQIMADPDHEEHDHMVDWTGGDFDPDAFDIDQINQILSRYKSR